MGALRGGATELAPQHSCLGNATFRRTLEPKGRSEGCSSYMLVNVRVLHHNSEAILWQPHAGQSHCYHF
eukprot:6427895-Amphidinium_carterae.1